MEWTNEMTIMMMDGVRETLFMTLLSTIFGYLLGLPMGVALAVTDDNGIRPNPVIYKVLDVIANVVRSIPFLILLILLLRRTQVRWTTWVWRVFAVIMSACLAFGSFTIYNTWKKLRDGGYGGAAYGGGGAFYRTHDRVFA